MGVGEGTESEKNKKEKTNKQRKHPAKTPSGSFYPYLAFNWLWVGRYPQHKGKRKCGYKEAQTVSVNGEQKSHLDS